MRNTGLNRRQVLGGLAALPILQGCGASGSSGSRLPVQQQLQTVRAAVLLPLSGQNAELGQQMAKAIWLHEDTGVLPARALVQDSGDTPAQASEAARIALSEGANVLIGPLSRSQTPTVLQVAGQTPVITLSNDRDLAQAGAWVFGVTPKQSADAVLRYAVAARKKRIVAIEGQDSVSQRALAALEAGAKKAGLSGVASISSATAPSDVPNALRRLSGGELPDILYVPDSRESSQSQAVAALEANVTTIGSLQWSGLSRDAFLRLDKACYTGPDPLQFNRTASFYQHHLNEQMGVIAALGVDALSFAYSRGAAPTMASREPFPGLLGAVRFNPDRTLERELAVLRINNGGVERVA